VQQQQRPAAPFGREKIVVSPTSTTDVEKPLK